MSLNIVHLDNNIKNKHLCLNMIVKNESKIIKRLLTSVLNIIDCYCICDTGSSDSTIEDIKNFFKDNNIPGKILLEPFRDFGYNRSYALKACEDIDVRYILLLDADMILEIGTHVNKENLYASLIADAYYIFQGCNTFFYKNIRIVRNNVGMKYWGVTHEYVDIPSGKVINGIEKKDFFINDVGDGGSKSDKCERDIRLLLKGLEEEKDNCRYLFYLANSYRDAKQFNNAIETYKKRITVGGWYEEIWYSFYCIGKCYKYMNDMPNAIFWWLEGYNFFPNRIENLFEIVNYYRNNEKYRLAYGYLLIADEERKKSSNDQLFLEKDIYEYKLDYELSIIGYYCNYKNYDLIKTCMKVLNYPHIDFFSERNTLSNYKFYSKKLKNYASNMTKYDSNFELLKNIGKELISSEFISSTPSIILYNNNLVLCLRYVNYRIDDNGGYINKNNITTHNIIAIFNIDEKEWKLKKYFLLEYDKSFDNIYVGLEDVKLFNHNDTILFNANRGLKENKMIIEHGSININTNSTKSVFINIKDQKDIEKNWVLFDNYCVYSWNPLIIGKINDSIFEEKYNINTPSVFKHLRGSTNGIRINNEIWFICHAVSYEDRRYYYHIFVVLDAITLNVKKYSYFFTFDGNKVEYTLGFIYFEKTNEFMIGYSILDRQTEFMIINKENIDEMMINN